MKSESIIIPMRLTEGHPDHSKQETWPERWYRSCELDDRNEKHSSSDQHLTRLGLRKYRDGRLGEPALDFWPSAMRYPELPDNV